MHVHPAQPSLREEAGPQNPATRLTARGSGVGEGGQPQIQMNPAQERQCSFQRLLPTRTASNSDTPTTGQSRGCLHVNVGQMQGRVQQRVIQDVSVARPLRCLISHSSLGCNTLAPSCPDKRPEDRLSGPGAGLDLVSPPIHLEGITA